MYINGIFTNLNGVNRAARWTGASWEALDPTQQFNSDVDALAILPDDSMYIAGRFTNLSGSIDRIAYYVPWYVLTYNDGDVATLINAGDKLDVIWSASQNRWIVV